MQYAFSFGIYLYKYRIHGFYSLNLSDNVNHETILEYISKWSTKISELLTSKVVFQLGLI